MLHFRRAPLHIAVRSVRARWVPWLCLILITASHTPAWADGYGNSVPQVTNILFTASAVGIVSIDDIRAARVGQYFSIDRKTENVSSLDREAFLRQFPQPWPPKPIETGVMTPAIVDISDEQHVEIIAPVQSSGVMRPSDGQRPQITAPIEITEPVQGPTILRASDGQRFEITEPNNCGEEMGDTPRALRYRKQRFPDGLLHDCSTVEALDIVDGNVWLGTADYLSTDSAEPVVAEGVVVRSMTKPITVVSVTEDSGLIGGPIFVVRNDPFTNTVWVATDWGLNRIDYHFKVVWGRFWYENYDPSTRQSKMTLSPSRSHIDVFGFMGRKLAIRDWPAYEHAVNAIPADVRRGLTLGDIYEGGGTERSRSQLAELTPFYIEAARSPVKEIHDYGLLLLCHVGTRRVGAYFESLASKDSKLDNGYWMGECERLTTAALTKLALETEH